jgi:hypothetical protein
MFSAIQNEASYGALSYEGSGIINFSVIFSRWDEGGVKNVVPLCILGMSAYCGQ